jgi:DNA-binding beta-propeller fold protein YncE
MKKPVHPGRLIRLFPVFLTAVFMASTAQGATLIVANKAEATASLIDLADGQVVATLKTGDGPHEVGISPDGRRALVTNYGNREARGRSLTLIDVPGAEVIKTIELGEYRGPHGVEWLDRRRAVVTVEDNRAVIVVDVDSGTVDQAILTEQEISHMVALAPGGAWAYTSNMGSGSITAIDLEKGERQANIKTGDGAEGITVSNDGKQVWVTNRAADTLTVLDAGSLDAVKEISSPGFPIRATATPGGQVLVTRARAGELVIYDVGTLDVVRTVSFDLDSLNVEDRLFGDRFGDSPVPIGVIVDGSGSHAFVALANADVIAEVDLATGNIVRQLRAGKEPDGMAWSSLDVKR